MGTRTVEWRITRRDGSLADPAPVELRDVDADELKRIWDEIKVMPVGEKRSAAVVRFRSAMDIFATFPGTTIGVPDAPGARPSRYFEGRYTGPAPTGTERESGAAVEDDRALPLKQGGAGHLALEAFASGERLTAYEASLVATGEHHAIRREATRLVERGFLRKDGTLPNPAPRGRDHVDAYVLTVHGRAELDRLSRLA